MKYFKCYETCIADDDFLHFYTPDEALQFVKDFFFPEDTSYHKDYVDKYDQQPHEAYEDSVIESEKTKSDLPINCFIDACLLIYGFDVTLVDLDREPYHMYRRNKNTDMWMMENPDE